tara:strand:- start:496 stop:1200 length:705 start_codon:yes stop_codon:yes gene_type:complete
MALPKLKIPEYELVVPSTQEKIKYRPFLVKEEKVLLLAMESEDDRQINDALVNTVSECTFGSVDGRSAPVFDMEYVFLQVRSKSVGESVELNITCPDDGKTKVPVKVDLSEVAVQMSVDHKAEIELTDDIKLVMGYPTLYSSQKVDGDSDTETVFKLMQGCISEIHFGDDVYRKVDISNKELDEFFGSLTSEMLAKVQEFFETMPKLRHIIDVKNPKTKKKNEVMLEGLGDFFT